MAERCRSASRRSTVTARWSTGRAGPASFLYQLALRHGDDRSLARAGRCATAGRRSSSGCSRGRTARTRRSWSRACAAGSTERGYPWDDADGEALVRAMRSWQPFPDTRPALLQAKAQGLRLVIVSNTDRDIIEHTLRHLARPVRRRGDGRRTARRTSRRGTVFEQALARIGEPPEQHPARRVRLQVRHRAGPGGRLPDGLGQPVRGGAAGPGRARLRVARPLGAG